MSKLTDEQIRKIGAALPEEHKFHSRIFARAIEEAATEPLLQRIAELESENEVLNRLMRSGEQRGVAKGLEESKAQITELEQRIEVGKNIVRNDMHRIGQLQAQVTGLERQLEEERKDAERYRWLRNGSNWPAVFASHDAPEPLRGEELDAAMQKGQS